MTNNEIMQANLLDIIFENRNKEYGAYALRSGYNNRLYAALGAGLSGIVLLIFINSFNRKAASVYVPDYKEGIVIKEYKMPEEIKQPEKPKVKEVVKVKTVVAIKPVIKIAEIKFTTPKITETAKNPIPPVDGMEGKIISDKTKEGTTDNGTVKLPANPPTDNTGNGNAGPAVPEKDFIVEEKNPEFPGGQEALSKFLSRYLITPGTLEEGEKKVVRVKFKVDKDGSVNSFEIMTSGGNEFDNEVVRVCRKMPKWIPAIQNGTKVPVSYLLPVTFIGSGG